MVVAEQLAYAGVFLVGGAGCFAAAARTPEFSDPAVGRSLATFLALAGVWSTISTLQLLAADPTLMIGLYTLGLIVGLATVPAWLRFCSAYAGRRYHRSRRLRAAVWVVYLAIVTIKLTNPIHGDYVDLAVQTTPFPHLVPDPAALYWGVTALAYVGAGIGLYMLFETFADSRLDSRPLVLLAVAAALPVVPTLVVAVRPGALLSLYYEPLGTAVFGLGTVTVARDTFVSIRTPARRQIADHLEEAVLVADADGRLVDYNRRAGDMFPDLEAAVGGPLDDLNDDLAATAAAGGGTVELTRPDGERFYRLYAPSITRGERTVGRAVVLADVTELERHRRELARQAERIDDFTEAMAHELRNPLNIIEGRLDQLDRAVAAAEGAGDDADRADHAGNATPGIDPGSARPAVDSAQSAAGRTEEIVSDLIAVVRYSKPLLETGAHPLEPLVRDAWDETGGDGCVLVVDAPGTVETDRPRCRELLRAVFAVHRERGATRVTVTRADGRLTVASDGDPLADDADRSVGYGAATGEGVGIRLANARTLAEMHGWTLSIGTADADSDAGPDPGRGPDPDPGVGAAARPQDRLTVSISGLDGGGDRLVTFGSGPGGADEEDGSGTGAAKGS